MTDENILNDERYKEITKLIRESEGIETDQLPIPAPAVLTKEGLGLEIIDWFKPLQPYCETLLKEHPNFSKNVFVMMKFEKNNAELDEIYGAIRETLGHYDLNALRADERHYSDQLWDNVRTYMLCCQYGVAVLENIVADEFNPNVALEYGFMNALNRPTMLLIEDRFRNMRADIMGTIVYTFHSRNIRETVTDAVRDWVTARLGFSR